MSLKMKIIYIKRAVKWFVSALGAAPLPSQHGHQLCHLRRWRPPPGQVEEKSSLLGLGHRWVQRASEQTSKASKRKRNRFFRGPGGAANP